MGAGEPEVGVCTTGGEPGVHRDTIQTNDDSPVFLLVVAVTLFFFVLLVVVTLVRMRRLPRSHL